MFTKRKIETSFLDSVRQDDEPQFLAQIIIENRVGLPLKHYLSLAQETT